jgi:hypothetical protein
MAKGISLLIGAGSVFFKDHERLFASFPFFASHAGPKLTSVIN